MKRNIPFLVHRLKELADIQFGPHCKGEDQGDAKYLMASHFDEFYQPTRFEHCFVDLDERTSKGQLNSNDVILAGKGQRSFAWVYDEAEGPCVPSSLFFIIRTNPEVVSGRYLALYLNSNSVQSRLKAFGVGLTIPSIPKKELSNIQVPIPPMEEQERIVELAELLDEDISLTSQLLEKKQALKNGILNKLIQ